MQSLSDTDARSRVLVIEDDEDTGAMLTSLLEDRGYDVKWTQQGEAGLRHCIAAAHAGRAPHLVLLDLRLPDMDGADLARSLHRALEGRLPIIVLSALPAQLVRETAREIGASAAMRKPFDVAKLLASIAAAVDPSLSPSLRRSGLLGPVAGISPELSAALLFFEARLPEVGAIRGGIAESTAWTAAHGLVARAQEELGPQRIAALGFDAALAQCGYLAASEAQAAFNQQAVLLRGAAPLDFALADSYCYALLQLAVAIGRALRRSPSASGSA